MPTLTYNTSSSLEFETLIPQCSSPSLSLSQDVAFFFIAITADPQCQDVCPSVKSRNAWRSAWGLSTESGSRDQDAVVGGNWCWLVASYLCTSNVFILQFVVLNTKRSISLNPLFSPSHPRCFLSSHCSRRWILALSRARALRWLRT